MRVELYRRQEDNLWAWRAKAPNGQIIATDGGQGYENKEDAVDIVSSLWAGVEIIELGKHGTSPDPEDQDR